jgi:oxygen-independent coproporphyrinogen-3 oxidase
MSLADATEPDVLARAVAEDYLVRADGRLRATNEGRKRLDALLAALVA